ncbi:Cytochrome P450 [Mycena sanguinolenta]|uniref:Cytochrome P450 n=1 Tax=Mycena sanguinolenta TaxID=230812 RepID=A0A8H6YV88_9AGAR|nr:Cytochrome P450 [Mycena sanguinolenta]
MSHSLTSFLSEKARILDLPPELIFIASLLPALLSPPGFTLLLLSLTRELRSISVPTWAAAILCILSIPFTITVKVQYRDFVNRREAASRGAILPPSMDAGFGGVAVVLRSVRDLATGYPCQVLGQRCEQLGNTYGIRIAFKERIFTCEPQHVKAILSTQFTSFEKGPVLREIFNPLLGNGVFASDGSIWKFHRDMTRPFFEKHRISDFDNFDSHVEDAITQLKNRLREGYPIDFQELMGRVALDCASAFLFGHDFRSLAEPLSYPYYISKPLAPSAATTSSPFASAFLEAQDITNVRMHYVNFWPLAEFWRNKITAPMRVLERFLDPVLDEVVSRRRDVKNVHVAPDSGGQNEKAKKVSEPETLLEHLVESTEDIKALREQLLNVSVAGRDTVTCLTTFAIYMLAEHPEVLAKLRQEIFERLGEKGRPSVEDIKVMKYLRAVLNGEIPSLSLRPFRRFNVDYFTQRPSVFIHLFLSISELPWRELCSRQQGRGEKPFYIPPNTMVPYAPIVMHRRKDLWGPDVDAVPPALRFDPERFIDERLHKYLVPNPFIFLPFNAGPRICLGQQFAYHEASFILIRILQAFSKIALAPNAQPPQSRVPDEWKTDDPSGWKRNERVRPNSALTMFVTGGLWVTMEE